MYAMRHPQHMLHMRKKSLISNFLTICRHQLNLNFGVAFSTPFPFIVLSNTLCQTLRTLKCLSTFLLNTLETNRSMVTWLMILLILIVWVMPYGTSSLQYTMLNGMLFILTTKLTLSELRSRRNLLWEQFHKTMTARRTLWNQSQLQSTRFCLCLLFQLKPGRKLISSPNTSTPRNRQLKTLPRVSMLVLENLTHKPLSLQSAHRTC